MKTISRVPARLGLGGGGTDIPSYFNLHGGAVLNCTINHFVYCVVSDSEDIAICESLDKDKFENSETPNKKLILHWSTIHYFQKNFYLDFNKIRMITFTDIPEGSGLGTSSALVVAMVKAVSEHFNLSFDKAKLVAVAYQIERIMCKLNGGFQDYISAVFGGINFTEFFANTEYLVTPLKISESNKAQLENQAVLVFTGLSRDSAKIITEQEQSINEIDKLEKMHQIKIAAIKLKHALITSNFKEFRKVFRESWEAKKATSASVSNLLTTTIEDGLMSNGAEAIKISGAGGGGFIIALTSSDKILNLRNYVRSNYEYKSFSIVETGAHAWKEE